MFGICSKILQQKVVGMEGTGKKGKKKTSAKTKRANEANVAKVLINVESTDGYMGGQCSVVFTIVYV